MSAREQEATISALRALTGEGSRGVALSAQCELVREITREDLPMLAQELRAPSWGERKVSSVSVLRTSHHMLAQLLASGVSDTEASFLCSRSPSSITALRRDPAFCELLAHYGEMQKEANFDAQRRLEMLGGSAIDILAERLETDPERFTNRELRELIETTLTSPRLAAIGGSMRGAPGLNVSINFVPSASGDVPTAQTIELKASEESAG